MASLFHCFLSFVTSLSYPNPKVIFLLEDHKISNTTRFRQLSNLDRLCTVQAQYRRDISGTSRSVLAIDRDFAGSNPTVENSFFVRIRLCVTRVAVRVRLSVMRVV